MEHELERNARWLNGPTADLLHMSAEFISDSRELIEMIGNSELDEIRNKSDGMKNKYGME